jgi:hypothetical protein
MSTIHKRALTIDWSIPAMLAERTRKRVKKINLLARLRRLNSGTLQQTDFIDKNFCSSRIRKIINALKPLLTCLINYRCHPVSGIGGFGIQDECQGRTELKERHTRRQVAKCKKVGTNRVQDSITLLPARITIC